MSSTIALIKAVQEAVSWAGTVSLGAMVAARSSAAVSTGSLFVTLSVGIIAAVTKHKHTLDSHKLGPTNWTAMCTTCHESYSVHEAA